ICEPGGIAVEKNSMACPTYVSLIGLVAAVPALLLLARPAAQAACAGGPVVFNCSGSDAAGTISYSSTPAPTYNLIGETISGSGGHGINVQTTDSSVANTLVITMNSTSSITLTDVVFNRGLNLVT